MSKEDNKEGKYVKRDVLLIVAFLTLLVGFFAGLVVGYRFDSTSPNHMGSRQVSQMSSNEMPPMQMAAQMPPEQMPPQSGLGGLMPGQFSKMVSGLEKQVAANPDNVQAWGQLGICYASRNEYDKGINACKKALELDPDNADIWTNLGILFSRKGQGAEAVEAFDKAVVLDPSNEKARFNKGSALIGNLKDREAGIAVWEEIVEMNPSAKTPNGQLVKDLIEGFKKQHP